MVFANLPLHEKEAFFSLLDEYFESRPGLFSGASSEGGDQRAAATAAVTRAFAAHPEATANLVSAGVRHGIPKSSPYAEAASNPEVSNAVGRVAAASLAFSNSNANRNSSLPPPAPPRRSPSSNGSESPPPGLVQRRAIGGVDTSSKMNAFTSAFSKSKQPTGIAPPPPPAFPAKKNAFAPPPTRRVTSESSTTSSIRETPPAPPPRHIPPQPEPEEEEDEGEWAEALYEYSSNDAGDLQVKVGQRILITERTSDDWWTGELNGKSGLFPASYVKVL